MPELDDFEIEPPSPPPDEPPREPPPSRRRWVVVLTLALLLLGVASAVFLVLRPRAAPRPTPAPSAGAEPSPTPLPAASPEPAELPPLDESDALVRELAKGLSSHPQLAVWLAARNLVRTFTVVVRNIADGENPVPHLRFLAPRQSFAVTTTAGRVVIDPRSYRRFEAFADGVAALDAAACARSYVRFEPLIDAAYRELGYPEGRFRPVLEKAIGVLLEVPIVRGDLPVVPRGLVYDFADVRLEALAPPQKQLLRMGPQNVGKVQAKLRELAGQPGVSAERPPGGSPRE